MASLHLATFLSITVFFLCGFFVGPSLESYFDLPFGFLDQSDETSPSHLFFVPSRPNYGLVMSIFRDLTTFQLGDTSPVQATGNLRTTIDVQYLYPHLLSSQNVFLAGSEKGVFLWSVSNPDADNLAEFSRLNITTVTTIASIGNDTYFGGTEQIFHHQWTNGSPTLQHQQNRISTRLLIKDNFLYSLGSSQLIRFNLPNLENPVEVNIQEGNSFWGIQKHIHHTH
jgi:hypothetical protein